MKVSAGALACILFANRGHVSAMDNGGGVGSRMRQLVDDCFGGSTWCPSLDECIQPWVETCPIDGDSFVGPTKLVCDGGRCSADEECSWTDGSAVMATYYFGEMNGGFVVPDGCSVNCTGCELSPGNYSSAVIDQSSVNATASIAVIDQSSVNSTASIQSEEDNTETLGYTSSAKGSFVNKCVKMVLSIQLSGLLLLP